MGKVEQKTRLLQVSDSKGFVPSQSSALDARTLSLPLLYLNKFGMTSAGAKSAPFKKPFRYTKNDHFAKTGSRQIQRNAEKGGVFLQRLPVPRRGCGTMRRTFSSSVRRCHRWAILSSP